MDYKEWVFDEAERKKFENWIGRIARGHTGTKDVRNQHINWTPLGKPLSQTTVALFTTGGVHRTSDAPFDVSEPHGDNSYREIPTDIDTLELAVTHTHYNHDDADRDINCMFPLDRLRELRDAGVIGGITPTAYSIMGFIPNPTLLVEKAAPELAQRIISEGADLVLMTCG